MASPDAVAMKRVHVYARHQTLFVRTVSKAKVGFWQDEGPIAVIQPGAAPESVGAAVLLALAASRSGIVPDLSNDTLNELLDAAGVSTWTEFTGAARCVNVIRASEAISIEPTSNFASKKCTDGKRGFVVIADRVLTLPLDADPVMLGTHVLQAVAISSDPDEKLRMLREELAQAAAPLFQELAAAGIGVASFREVANRGVRAGAAVPVLLRWLHATPPGSLKTAIHRCLSKLPPSVATVQGLIKEFTALDGAEADGMKWQIGATIAEHASLVAYEDFAALAEDPRHGKARQMLVLALGKLKNPAALELLIRLLSDDEIAGHAVSALAILAPPSAAPDLKKFTRDPRPWVSRAAIQALSRISKRPL